jgi:ABC-2 type transport system permease protein
MNVRIVGSIVRKDLREFLHNRFFVFMTLLVLVVWVAIFWFMPDTVDETIRIGVYHGGLDTNIETTGSETGLDVIALPSETELRTAVDQATDGIVAGISFPPDFDQTLAAGGTPTVILLIPASLPAEQRLLLEGVVGEIGYALIGSPPPVNPVTEAVILGTDRVGNQVSLQEQMRPMLLVLVLMVETFALSALIAVEIQQRTVVAVLATPARVGDFLAAKGTFGIGLAFFEVMLLAALIGALATNAPLIIVTLLLGAVLVTGFGMVAGAFGRDFLETLFVSMLFMIPLMIPAFGALFPGSTATWIKVLPTYGLVDAVVGVTIYGEGWAETGPILVLLAGWGLLAFAAGALILKRRVATL